MVEKRLVVLLSEEGCKFYSKENFKISGELQGTASNVGGMYKLDQVNQQVALPPQE
jgi:hypothetical protein